MKLGRGNGRTVSAFFCRLSASEASGGGEVEGTPRRRRRSDEEPWYTTDDRFREPASRIHRSLRTPRGFVRGHPARRPRLDTDSFGHLSTARPPAGTRALPLCTPHQGRAPGPRFRPAKCWLVHAPPVGYTSGFPPRATLHADLRIPSRVLRKRVRTTRPRRRIRDLPPLPRKASRKTPQRSSRHPHGPRRTPGHGFVLPARLGSPLQPVVLQAPDELSPRPLVPASHTVPTDSPRRRVSSCLHDRFRQPR